MTSRDPKEHAVSGETAGFTIVKATFGDLRAVAAIQKASFRPVLAYGMFPLVTLHLLPFVTFLVARDTMTNEVIGCIIGDRHRGDVRIMNIAVRPDWRRHGVARALLHEIAARLPGGNIVLMAEESNHGAIALYESEGFTRVGRQRDYYGPRRHGIEMTLRREPSPPKRNGKPVSGRIRV